MNPVETPVLSNTASSAEDRRGWAMAVVACLAVWLAMRIVFFVGFEGSDDMQYVRFAGLWDRVPVNQWEVRLLADALIGTCLKAFGYHEWAAALPSTLASLGVLIAVLLACKWMGTLAQAWWAGLLVAVLPADVANATIVSAHTVMVGFLAAGTLAFVMAPESRTARWVAAISLPLGVIAHYNASYYVAALVLAALLVDRKSYLRPAAIVFVTGIAFMLADMLLFKVLFGDAFLRLRVNGSDNMDPSTRDGLTFGMIGWSLQQLVAGKPFGIAMLIASLGAAIHYHRFSRPVRVLCVSAGLFWLVLSFGSYVPWAYRPFWRNARYLHPLVMPVAMLFSAAIVRARHKRIACTLGALALVFCPLILSAGGTWGQSIRTSRELLDYALQHPERTFVTDVFTANEIYTLNGLSTPPNVVGTMDQGRTHFLDPGIRRIPVLTADTCDALLINPLNVDRNAPFAALIAGHLGSPQYQSAPVHRPLCRVLVPLQQSPWGLRRPPAIVHSFAPGSQAPPAQIAGRDLSTTTP